MQLYHGTSAHNLHPISLTGVLPRGGGRKNNYTHTIGSNPDCVYLTSAYGLYFAGNASSKDNSPLAIIEVIPDHLTGLCADEDALEQTNRGRDGLPESWDIKRRTIYYRSRVHLYRAEDSLKALGTCSHKGAVPAAALGRVVVVDRKAAFRLVMECVDPTISTLNYRYMGRYHEAFGPWLFGDTYEFMRLSGRGYTDREGIMVYANINEALARRNPQKEGLHVY